MLYSKSFIKTKKETPRGANSINQVLLERGSFIYQVGSGIFSYLPLGCRVYEKVRKIIIEELSDIGCQEVALPVLHPAELWKKTGRLNEIGDELFKIGGNEPEFVLAMTHEEVITPLAKIKIQSESDLPFTLNQISKKIRNEVRPRGGLIRLKEFNMQDAYSFHATKEQLDKTFNDFVGAYKKIFEHVGLKAIMVEADPGMMGGSDSREFMVINPAGEDRVMLCGKCNKAFNGEVAPKNNQCPCGEKLHEEKGIELAHIFKLGTKYSEKFDLNFTDSDGKTQPVLMGCYGIGLDRLIAAVVEENHDEMGIIWPEKIAPADCYLIDLEGSRGQKVYDELTNKGFEVLFDDRDVSAGVKFSDADLLGIPVRLTISAKTLEQESIELKKRSEKETKLIKISELEKIFK